MTSHQKSSRVRNPATHSGDAYMTISEWCIRELIGWEIRARREWKSPRPVPCFCPLADFNEPHFLLLSRGARGEGVGRGATRRPCRYGGRRRLTLISWRHYSKDHRGNELYPEDPSGFVSERVLGPPSSRDISWLMGMDPLQSFARVRKSCRSQKMAK